MKIKKTIASRKNPDNYRDGKKSAPLSLEKFSEQDPNPVLQYSISKKKIVYSNVPGEKILGNIQLRNKTISAKWKAIFNNAIRLKKITEYELDMGQQIFMISVVPLKGKSLINLYGRDITAIRVAEQEIRTLSAALGKTENAVIIANRLGKIQWVNEGFEKLSGYKLSEILGTPGNVLRRGKKTGLDSDSAYYKKIVQSKQPVSYEARNFRKDGSEYWTISTFTPILDRDGEVENIVIIDSDITIKKKAEIEMRKARQLADEAAKAREFFIANISHEIRTPMNAIMGIIQLLKKNPLNEEQQEYMRSLNYAGECLLNIINDVLDISKMEAGKTEIEQHAFNLEELLKEIVKSAELNAINKNITLSYFIDKNVSPRIQSDPFKINQILSNLLGNAIKFTEKGSVRLEVYEERNTGPQKVLRFEVSDTGIGIKKEWQQQIFKPFEQGQMESTRKHGGTGLGLSIVKRLTELLEGSVDLESVPGKGSLFTVRIPFTTPKENSHETLLTSNTISVTEENFNGKKILLVEDNALNQMVAEKFLVSLGLQVKIAANGQAAVNNLKTENYDLVLMDIQMPEMDGYEAVKHIRRDFKAEKSLIPVIAMTAHAFRGEREKCLESGMNDYISKPLNFMVLKQKLASALTNPKPEHT